jgi:AcrR family transcriptional regulator
MGRPRKADIDVATTERILAAAEQEFADAGFAGARLEDIAATAGLRRPSLLYHYPTKDALYAAAVARSFEQLRNVLGGAIAEDGTFEKRLDRLAGTYVSFLIEHPAIARLVVRELMNPSATRRPGERAGVSAGPVFEEELARTLDLAESFIRFAGKGSLRPGLDVRAAILQVAGGAILYAIAGPLRPALWREPKNAAPARHAATVQRLARSLVLEPVRSKKESS